MNAPSSIFQVPGLSVAGFQPLKVLPSKMLTNPSSASAALRRAMATFRRMQAVTTVDFMARRLHEGLRTTTAILLASRLPADLFRFDIRSERAFSLPHDIINVCPVRLAVTHIAPRPGWPGYELAVGANNETPWRIVRNKPVVVVLDVHVPSQRRLFEIVQTSDGLGFGASEGRQEQSCKDCNDADYDQKLD